MNRINTLGQVANFLCYILLQTIFVRSIVLFHSAFCFIYVAFLLLLPWRSAGLPKLLVIGFLVGLLVDALYDSWGLHAAASVLLVHCRAYLLQFMLPINDYEAATQPTLHNLGLKRFSFFALILIGIHHVALFSLDAYDTALVLTALYKAVCSTLFTYVSILFVYSIISAITNK